MTSKSESDARTVDYVGHKFGKRGGRIFLSLPRAQPVRDIMIVK